MKVGWNLGLLLNVASWPLPYMQDQTVVPGLRAQVCVGLKPWGLHGRCLWQCPLPLALELWRTGWHLEPGTTAMSSLDYITHTPFISSGQLLDEKPETAEIFKMNTSILIYFL